MVKKSSTITEREVAADLAAELDRIIQQGGTPFEKATVEHHAGGLYPDITIWTAYQRVKQAFAFWELKPPGQREDLSRLPSKAHALHARYVVVWNFQNGELYEVEGEKLRSIKSYPVPVLNSLEEWAVAPRRISAVEQARNMLDDLARLERGESLMPFVPDKFYFTGILEKAIHRLVPVLQAHIVQQKKNREKRNHLDRWAVKQGYPTGLTDLDALLARHWAYSLAVRILFYFTVRRDYPGLPDLRPDTTQPIADVLHDAFSRAQAVDWQAVFERSPLDELGLPTNTESILRELLEDFRRYDFGLLKEDVIGQIMEGLIPEKERHALGQYFTREDLVDFIIGFVAHQDQAHYVDPTCGSGTFLNRLYSRIRWLSGYRAAHCDILERLWGFDVAHFPAELATINLFRQDVSDRNNFPRIVVSDFFQVQPGKTFSFPPPKATDDKKIPIDLPLFDGMVGNFPYIRQELIERQIEGYKTSIVQAIAREWFWKDQSLFTVKGIRDVELQRMAHDGSRRQEWLQKQIEDERIALRLSGQADIYAYLFYYAAALLKEGGRMGIVTSNAWLDVAYGVELKRFFLNHFKIVAIVASWCEPWFEDAAINTAFVILERCEDARQRDSNIVRFVKVKKPLAELLPQDLLLREAERWQKVDALVREIETADARITAWGPTTGLVQPLHGIHTVETDAFRIRLAPQAELEAELTTKGETAKWGLYIRAPQVYFDILARAGARLVPLSQVADVRRGYTTGINDFFYLEPLGSGSVPGTLRVKNAQGWVGEIEEECLRPVIKSPKEATGLVVEPQNLRYRLFLPPIDPSLPDPYQELQKRYPLAYEYVKWGEQQHTPQGQSWSQVPSVKGRKAWWLLGERKPASFLTMGFIDRRFFVLENAGVLASDVMFEWDFRDPSMFELSMSLVNSTLTYLLLEMLGRQNLGDGVLKIIGPELSALLIPDPSTICDADRGKIVKAYKKLKKRAVMQIDQEVKQKDRRALDEAVLAALGLDPDLYLPKIYEGLVEMVNERLALPGLRAARQKREKGLSLEQIKEKIRREGLSGGLKPITAFLPAGRPTMMDIALTGRPVSWRDFFGEYTLLDASDNEVGKFQGNEQQARYIVYAARPGQYMVNVPVDPIIIGKAVQAYEQYLRETAQTLLQRALEATRDHRQAGRIVREILESFNLPPLAVSEAMR